MEVVGIALYLFFFLIFTLVAHKQNNNSLGMIGSIILLIFAFSMFTEGLTVQTGTTTITTVGADNVTTAAAMTNNYGKLQGTSVWQGFNYYAVLGFILMLVAVYLLYDFSFSATGG
jgi:predicted tellurium resistance membrane protein TerC